MVISNNYMHDEFYICEQLAFEECERVSDTQIILQKSSLKDLTFRFWLTGTFWILPMLLAGQKPGVNRYRKMQKKKSSEFYGCHEVTPLSFSRFGLDTAGKHYALGADVFLGTPVHVFLQD